MIFPMANDTTIDELAGTVGNLVQTVSGLAHTVEKLSVRVEDVDHNLNELARMTQEQFSVVDEKLSAVRSEMNQRFERLEATQKQMLEILVELPSQKVTEKLAHKVQDHEERLTLVERTLHPVA